MAKTRATVMHIAAGDYFATAERAANLARTAPPDKQARDAALTAIVFSVVTLEAFINELEVHATWGPTARPLQIGALADYLKMCRKEEKVSLRQKYFFAKLALTGTPYEKGARPWQEFDLLLKIRNALVHPEADSYDCDFTVIPPAFDTPTLVQELANRRLIDAPPKTGRRAFRKYVAATGVAEWACATASGMIRSLLDDMPQCAAKKILGWQWLPREAERKGKRANRED